MGCPVSGRTVELPGAELRFEEGAPAGLRGIVVRGLDPAAEPTDVAGMTVVTET